MFLAAHLGDTTGGIYRVERSGKISAHLTHIDNHPLPPCNFIYLDHRGRLWLTASTRKIPRVAAYRSDIADGFIAVIDNKGARVVADNIGYTNEVCLTPDGSALFINATFSRETLSFDVTQNNARVNRRTVAHYGEGTYPDGVTIDNSGDLWITCIISNRLIRVNPKAPSVEVVLEDADKNHVQWVEKAFLKHELGPPHLDGVKSHSLQNISSLAFGGPDLKQLYFGCLLGQQLATCESPFH